MFLTRLNHKWHQTNLLNKALIISSFGHIFLLLFAIMGQVSFDREPIDLGQPIEVTLSPPETELASPPKPVAPQSEPIPTQAIPKPPAPPPKPPPKISIPKKPKVSEVTPPKPEVVKPEPPKPSFNASLRNLQQSLEQTPPAPKAKAEPKKSLAESVREAVETPQPQEKPRSLLAKGLKEDEMARVRDQVIRCWNPPVGARNADQMRAVIEAELAPDKTVITAVIRERSAETTSSFAESALRAVLVCHKLDVPDGKYDLWNRLILTFTPSDIF